MGSEAPAELETEDEGHQLRFHWIPVAGDGLEAINLKPAWMADRLRHLPPETEHLILSEPPR